LRLLRVYFKERRVNTVKPEVLKYCLLTKDNHHFRMPTNQDVCSAHVVITTLTTSAVMDHERLKGHWSHIFVDEAAQALECEAIMPLADCNDSTVVVLAGDHMQISPKVITKNYVNQN
jgi:superfamily I DNA and/or RNA helicase